MNVAITKGIKITVNTFFRKDLTRVDKDLFFFTYNIRIENHSKNKVQLISRFWRIMDSLSPIRFVEGKGVVGEQPILESGETYEYSSGCDLSSGLGYMEGHFEFITLDTDKKQERFQVEVPRFLLEYSGKLN